VLTKIHPRKGAWKPFTYTRIIVQHTWWVLDPKINRVHVYNVVAILGEKDHYVYWRTTPIFVAEGGGVIKLLAQDGVLHISQSNTIQFSFSYLVIKAHPLPKRIEQLWNDSHPPLSLYKQRNDFRLISHLLDTLNIWRIRFRMNEELQLLVDCHIEWLQTLECIGC
jgi:hypothetical protein